MRKELHFSQSEKDGYHYYGIIPHDDSLKYELVEEDKYFMNRRLIGYFRTQKEAREYIKAWAVR